MTKTRTRMRSRKAAIILLLSFLLENVDAQTTTATCQSGYEWMVNSLHQSPCLVAAFLGHQCTPDSSFNVPPLVSGQQYLPPNVHQSNDCQCSSVYYSLLSGCAACQGSSLDTFTTWTKNCSEKAIRMQNYPLATPSDTQIPSWAYLPLKNGAFDIGLARQNATGQDSYGEPQHFSVGAIIGLVLGSVAVLSLIGAAIWMYCRLQNVKSRGFDALHSIEGSNKSSPSRGSANEPPSYTSSQQRQQGRQSTEQQEQHQQQQKQQHKSPMIRYDKIEGPPRPPRKFLFFPIRSTTVVKSYRPGLNFDLDKGRRGDLLELSENSHSSKNPFSSRFSLSATHLTSPPPSSGAGSSTLFPSSVSLDATPHSGKLIKKPKHYNEHYEHYPLPLQPTRDKDRDREQQVKPVGVEPVTSPSSLSNLFSRPKEVKPLKKDVRVDLAAETEDETFIPLRPSESSPRAEALSNSNENSARFGSTSRVR